MITSGCFLCLCIASDNWIFCNVLIIENCDQDWVRNCLYSVQLGGIKLLLS